MSLSWLRLLAALAVLSLAACSEKPTTEPPPEEIDIEADAGDTQLGDADDAQDDAAKPDADPDTPLTGCEQDNDCEGLVPDLKACERAACVDKKCAAAPATEGTACDDGKECTAEDQCDAAGTCVGSVQCVESKDGVVNVCKVGACGDDGKCAFTNAKFGDPCDDGNACTEGDICAQGGLCTSGKTVKSCDDGEACTADVCDPKTGDCASTPIDAGGLCDDGNACTKDTTCDAAGKCGGGSAQSCDDGNPCTVDSCIPGQGCSNAPAANGAACELDNKCVINGVCSSGKCLGEPDPKVDDGNPCTKDVCDPAKGATSTVYEPLTGTGCDDGDSCSKSDTCANGKCVGTPLSCNDGNACTDDKCDPKKCVEGQCGLCDHPAKENGAECEDGSKCTTKDACTGGACKGQDWDKTGQCDDKNTCTNDSCQPAAGCLNVPADGKFCDDGDPCTVVDKCGGDKCKGVAKDCKDTNSCTNDACDPKTGACSHTQFAGQCDDNDKCTAGDVCVDGLCGGKEIDCDDGNPCTQDICDTIKGCLHLPAAGGTPCDDGLSCTLNDYCDAGKCTQLPKDYQCQACSGDLECQAVDDNNFCNGLVKCIDSSKGKVCAVDKKTVITCDGANDNACAKNTCQPDDGSCKVVLKAEGSPCASGDKCVDNPTCTAGGKCEGIKIPCDDGESCTVDSCEPGKGCVHTPVADGGQCDDGNICTPNEACKAGKCAATENTCSCNNDSQCVKYDDGNLCNGVFKCAKAPGAPSGLCEKDPQSLVVCPALQGQPCMDNVCTPESGQCAAQPKGDGQLCNDGNACTVADTCAAGKCGSTKKLDCGDDNNCTVDVCDKVFGCANAPLAQGAVCNDGDDCTSKDTCVNGVCAGQKLQCNDGNACTVDLCKKVGGCAVVLDDTLPCDDGDPCTGVDKCKDGACAGPPLACDDGNPCTVDACDGKGGCKNVLIEGKDCDDGDACTVGDTCLAGKCGGKAKNCDDGSACTEESCQSGTCVVTPSIGKACSDGNACTSEDACDGNGACSGKVLDCSTGTICLKNLACSPVTGCVNAPNDNVPCSDNDMCTISDTCQGGGCQGLKLNCNDNDVCTSDSCDPKKGCLIAQNTCDDGNPCTVDSCDKAKGCQHENVDGAACEDGDKCTEKGQCNVGKCESVAVKCDDKNGCTLDSCDPKTGCVALPGEDTQVTCDDGNPCTTDACQTGKCVGEAVVCDDGNPCTVDSCDPLKGCVVADLKDGSGCDDGEGCTENTVCQGGICSGGQNKCPLCTVDKDCAPYDNNNKCDGTYKCEFSAAVGLKICQPKPDPVVCDSTGDTACAQNQCDLLTGACKMTQLVNGTACEDGFGCTTKDFCSNGACVAGAPTDCSGAADGCNDATCIEDELAPKGFSCQLKAKADNTLCDADFNGCTAGDKCLAGKCQKGATVSCEGVAGECQAAACTSLGADKFECTVTSLADDSPCSDGQLCTGGDFCKTGKCQPGTKPYDCTAESTVCALGFCDKAANGGAGGCVPKPQNEGQQCDSDKNGCTVGDKCVAGTCVPGAPPDCDDQSGACTVGACKSQGEATFQCIGAPKADQLPCEADQNGCTVGDACKAGKCQPGAAMDCSSKTSKDGCLLGTCKSLGPAAATCITAPAPVGQVCNADDNGCTKGDACNKDGACVPGNAVDCLAFTGSCAQGSCQSTGASTFTCQGTPKPDGTVCDADQDGCTIGDKCAAGKCVAGAAADCSAKAATCLTGKCLNKGSDKYECDALPLSEGTPCDADQNGCTFNDACQLGFCTTGDLQTCSQFASLCGDTKCSSTGSNAFKCDVVPKESYPPLDPPVACTTTDEPPKCASGYQCVLKDAETKTGTCEPTVTLFCDDKNLCTEADACQGGKCVAGKQKDCDDLDPCTLDSCDAGKCANVPIAGCKACVDTHFELTPPQDWLAVSEDDKYMKWAVSNKKPFGGQSGLRVEWLGPHAKLTTMVTASYRHRRIYIEKGTAAPALDFYVSMTVSAQTCDVDDLAVYINGNKVWSKCDNTQQAKVVAGTAFEHVTVSLAAYAGAPADIEFRAIAGFDDKASGTIDVDNIRVTGACGPGCLGADFEARIEGVPEGEPTPPEDTSVPIAWNLSSTNAAYVNWKLNDKSAHTGKRSFLAAYTGATSKAETAKFVIPSVRPELGDKLWFAVKANVGDEGCGSDDLIVKIAGKEVYKRCNNLAAWKEEVVDLAAYASQTVDIEFSVVTAVGAGAKGTFELDDIAIAGKCTYACIIENFDAAKPLAKWTASSTDPLTLKPWAASTAAAVSTPNSVFASHTATAKNEKVSLLNLNGRFDIPILGGTYVYQANMFFTGGKCGDPNKPNDPSVSPVLLRGIINKNQALTPQAMFNDGNFTINEHCSSTPGWAEVKGEMPSDLNGKSIGLSLLLMKMKENNETKAYIDDLRIMCR